MEEDNESTPTNSVTASLMPVDGGPEASAAVSGAATNAAVNRPTRDAVSPETIWLTEYGHPVPWNTQFPPLTVPDMFFASSKAKGDAALLDFMGRTYSYADNEAAIRKVAKGLQQLGVTKGTRVGLFLPNTPHYVAAYYGAMLAGAIVVNFSPLYTVEELAAQVEDSGTEILFTLSASALLPTALKVLDKSSLKRLVVGSVAGVLPPVKSFLFRMLKKKEVTPFPENDDRITHFSDLIANDGQPRPVTLDAEDVALLQYTGGTTGSPKGAMLTHQNLTANARQVNAIDPRRDDEAEEDRIMGILPFFHVFANTCVLNRTVNHGGLIVMLPRFDAAQVLAAIARTKPVAMPGVPTMYQALLDNPETAKIDFSSLRVCISGGAPMPHEVRERFETLTGSSVVEGYGLTESSGVVSCNPYEGVNRSGTIGQPVPGTHIRLVDKEDPTKLAAPGEPGELLLKGPQMMKGYWNRPDADAEVFIDGYMRTGDVAILHPDGYIEIVDRLKDMIAVGGFKVFPSQIEDVLYKHDAVKEALVIGIPDTYRGETPKAFVTLQEGTEITAPELMKWLNPQLGKHERVSELEIRAELPKTMIGKLSRKELVAEEKAKREAQAA